MNKLSSGIILLIVGLIVFIGPLILWSAVLEGGTFFKYLIMTIGADVFSKGWNILETIEKEREIAKKQTKENQKDNL